MMTSSALADAMRQESHQQRRRARPDGHGVPDAQPLRECRLERLDGGPLRQHAALQHPQDRRLLLFADDGARYRNHCVFLIVEPIGIATPRASGRAIRIRLQPASATAHATDHSSRVAHDKTVRRNVSGHHRPCPHQSPSADRDVRQDYRARSDRRAPFHANAANRPIARILERPRRRHRTRVPVIREDGARTDERAVLDRDTMKQLCSVLHLDIVSYCHASGRHTPPFRECSDRRSRPLPEPAHDAISSFRGRRGRRLKPLQYRESSYRPFIRNLWCRRDR